MIISEEIAPDLRPEEELCLNLKDGKCLFCINNCPTKALTLEGIDRHRCHDHILEVRKEFSLRDCLDVMYAVNVLSGLAPF